MSGHEVERATLYRLLRRGTITESDLETQIAEISVEHTALEAERERLKSQWERAQNSQSALESAGELLDKLRLKLDVGQGSRNGSEGELAWDVKRRIVEELVAGIEVESLFDPTAPRGQQRTAVVYITYRFEAPDAKRPARGKRNNGTLAASRDAMDEANSSGLSLVNMHRLHSSPSAATDRTTLPIPSTATPV